MSRSSSKSELSPSVTGGGIDMGRKTEPSVTSGGVGVTTEVGNIGGVTVTAGASVEISPINLGINYDPSENSVSVASGAEIPGGLLGVTGGITVDLDTGEIVGGIVGGEVAGLGINVSASKDGLGVELTVQIPFTPIEVSLGFGFPSPKEPTPTLTPLPDNKMPSTWEPEVPPLPPPLVEPGQYYVKTTTRTGGRFWYHDGDGSWRYEPTNSSSGIAPIIIPPNEPTVCTPITQQNIANAVTREGGIKYIPASSDFSYPHSTHITQIIISSPAFYIAPFGLAGIKRSIYFRRAKVYGNEYHPPYIVSTANLLPPYYGIPKKGEGTYWEFLNWELIHQTTVELVKCGQTVALPSVAPFPNPPPRKQKKMDNCCKENLKLLRAIHTGLGISKFPGKLPTTIIQKVVKEGEEPPEPAQVPINDLADLLIWMFKRDDERWGQWEIQIDIKDSDITKEGDQKKSVSFPNLAESVAEIEGQVLSIMANVEALVALQVKNLAESGMARQEAIKGYLASKAIIKYMAFKSTEVDVPVPMTFTAGAETISTLLQESEGHIKGTDYLEKETLRDVYLDLLQAAAIIRAVHWQRIDTKTDTKSQLLSILRTSVNLADSITKPQSSTSGDGSEKAFDPEKNFEDFIDSVEDGFRNTTGMTDIQNPYGRSPDRRPRIRQIGDNISQAGGKE